MNEKENIFTFFKKIATNLPFSEERKTERLFQKELEAQKTKIINEVTDLINADGLVTVYELVGAGYDLTENQKKLLDSKINALIISDDLQDIKKLKLLIESGYNINDNVILKTIINIENKKNEEKIEIFKERLLDPEMSEKIIAILKSDMEKLLNYIDIQYKEANHKTERKKKHTDIADIFTVPSLSKSSSSLIRQNVFENIDGLYFGSLFEYMKKSLSASVLISLSSDLQTFIEKREVVESYLNSGLFNLSTLERDTSMKKDAKKFKEKINAILINDFATDLDSLLLETMGLVTNQKNKSLPIEIQESIFKINKEIKEMSAIDEEYLLPIKTKFEAIKNKINKEEFINEDGMERLNAINEEIKECKVEIQINKIRRLSAIENYSNSFKLLR